MMTICLTEIILHSAKIAEREEASAIKDHLENFGFILLLCLDSKVLENIDKVLKALQKETASLGKA